MEIAGKIIAALGERSGTSARTGSEWRAASYVLETVTDQYPRKVCFDVFGADRIQNLNIKVGETLTVKFDIDAHEYKGRWYNSIRAYGVSRDPQQGNQPMGSAPEAITQGQDMPAAPDAQFAPTANDADLPF